MAADLEVKIEGEEIQAALERLQRLLGGSLRGELGTNVRYAAVHQFGATIKAKHAPWLTFRVGEQWARKKQVTIPARPYMPPLPHGDLNAEDQMEVLTILDDRLKRAFEGERITGPEAMTEVMRYLKTSTQLRFRDQQGPDGARWRPTLRGGQILRLTARLRNSITYLVR